MKTYCICIALSILALNYSFGEIKNGYANGINSARESLKVLCALLLEEDLTAAKKKTIKTKIKEVVNFITYYELTENLLRQFKTISPELYNEIDTIKDLKGRHADVYIKFITEEESRVQAWGVTNVAQASGDTHAYHSEYGERTVSVKVWAVNKALLVLAHELGHVKYQLPNLSRYVEYYKTTYRPGFTESNYIGHGPNDKSGKSASAFESKFRENYTRYLKNDYNQVESPLALVKKIQKDVLSGMLTGHPLASL